MKDFSYNIEGITICCSKFDSSVTEQFEKTDLALKYAGIYSQRKSLKRKEEFAAWMLLLERMLGKTPEIKYDENGKPWLKDDALYISVSHCKEIVCVGLAHFPIGIDIEPVSDRIVRLAERFMTPKEFEELNSSTDIATNATICWCGKEAIYKLIGEKALDFKNAIEIKKYSISSNFYGSVGFSQNIHLNSIGYDNKVIVVAYENRH